MSAFIVLALILLLFWLLTVFLDGAGPCPRCGKSVSWGCRCGN